MKASDASCLDFLELLARGASAEELESVTLPTPDSEADQATTEMFERARVYALRIHAVLERQRRRDAELSALYETAGDLAGVRGVDDVLHAIVQRARRLLRSDIAYLSLNDEERSDTYVHVLDGAVSNLAVGLRIPFGVGLGGLVAQTNNPWATADYFADQRFEHRQEVDRVVRAESLVSILGVPLQLGTRVIGVLFAANRTVRPFSPDEVTLLGSLAAHAVIAIDNARLFTERDEANQLLRVHAEAVERAAEVHDRLMAVVLDGGGFADLAGELRAALGGQATIVDEVGCVLASTSPEHRVGEQSQPDMLELCVRARKAGRVVDDGTSCAASVQAGGEHLGTVLLTTTRPFEDGDWRSMERGALVTALVRLLHRSVADTEARIRGDLLEDVLATTNQDLESLRERARRLGANLDIAHAVVAAHYDGDGTKAGQAASFLASSHGGLAVRRDERIVLALPRLAPAEAAELVTTELGRTLSGPVTAGGAGPAFGVAGIRSAYQEARRCVDALLALGRVGGSSDADELGILGMLVAERSNLPRFVRTTLGRVLDYDARHGTALVHTLAAYFRNGSSLTDTAAELQVHHKTVSQRLNRVSELVGDNWRSPDRALDLQMALRVHALLAPGALSG